MNNDVDLQIVEILTNSIKDYHGTLVVISHEEVFLDWGEEYNTAILMLNDIFS